MKLKCKVAVIMQRTIPRADGGTDQLTIVKMTPVDLPAGDLQLGFYGAEVDWHPEVRAESGDRNRVIIAKETLIRSVKVGQDGDPFVFEHDKEYLLDVAAATVAAPKK